MSLTSDISFDIAQGERVGLVGESGCGKSITGLAIMGLLSGGLRATGSIRFDGVEMVGAPARTLNGIRGARIGMIFQEPMTALDPVFPVGEQIAETVRVHMKTNRREARDRSIEMLRSVRIPDPERRYHAYPHEMSGGMRQRIVIAIALCCEPSLLIADEPTTALDVTVQAQIIDLLIDLSERGNTSLILVTHDLGVVAQACTRVLTMYAGQLIEDAPARQMLLHPWHPYTSGLIRCLPRLSEAKARLPAIPGRIPAAADMPEGCRFEPRCVHAESVCHAPQDMMASDGRAVRCVRAPRLHLQGAA
jgi:peptide/nickel transport system ATP-binding protein